MSNDEDCTSAEALSGADELISLALSARLAGLASGPLRHKAADGDLKVPTVMPRLNMTSRCLLHKRLQARSGSRTWSNHR
jgi:hypothetical protein